MQNLLTPISFTSRVKLITKVEEPSKPRGRNFTGTGNQYTLLALVTLFKSTNRISYVKFDEDHMEIWKVQLARQHSGPCDDCLISEVYLLLRADSAFRISLPELIQYLELV